MKLKKYLQFIKESIKTDKKMWKLSEADILDFFNEILDQGYSVDIKFGFSGFPLSIEFTQKVEYGVSFHPSYWIEISERRGISNVDVTDVLAFACDIINDQSNSETLVYDEGGNLNINDITIKGGLWIGQLNPNDLTEDIQIDGSISLFVRQKEVVELTQKELAEYYNWKVDEISSDFIYIHVDLENMANILLKSKADHKDTLISKGEDLWEYYNSGDYNPDTNSLFDYDLDNDNIILSYKAIIKEFGGIEELIKKYDEFVGMTEDEIINSKNKDILKELCDNSEIIVDIKQTCGDWSSQAHAS